MKHQMPIEEINYHIRKCDMKTPSIGEISVVIDWIDIGISKESKIIMIEYNFDIL